MKTHLLISGFCHALTLLIAASLLPGCAHFAGPPEDLDYSRTRLSEGGLYRATILPQSDPIPQGRLHTWTLHLETADGAPVARARQAHRPPTRRAAAAAPVQGCG